MKSLINGFSFVLLFICVNAQAQFTTNLPIVIITTPGAIGNTQIQGTMSIIDNISGVNTPLDPPTFTGMIGIKERGNAAYAKKSYSVETWSAATISLDTSLLGMPSDNDWVLLGNYPDRSLMRGDLAFNLHSKMGRYAPRMAHCEVVINNQYVGIYNFGEQIKRGAGRLDIAKLTVNDNFGYEMEGGYIWKVDDGTGPGWQSMINPPYAITQKINYIYDYPQNSDITPAQKAYIKSYVDSFETELNSATFQDSLNGWRKHGAVNSFIDFIIMQELSKNYEAYRQNAYFYKDKGTKMRPGPLWGFDLAWKNTMNCNGSKDTGWTFNFGGACGADPRLPSFWWQKLSQDTIFMRDLRCRYNDFRGAGNLLDTVKIFQVIDSINTRLNAQGAITRNFTQWPIWGVNIVNEPTPMAANYAEEVSNLKTFIKVRIAWLDTKWTKPSNCVTAVGVHDADIDQLVSVYPIPANDKLMVDINGKGQSNYQIQLFNIQGNLITGIKNASAKNQLDVSHLAKGIYFIHIRSGQGSFVKKVIVE